VAVWVGSAQLAQFCHRQLSECILNRRACLPGCCCWPAAAAVPNRYAGDAEGRGGIYNFVTKRGLCHGANSKISWTQVRGVFCVCLRGSWEHVTGLHQLVSLVATASCMHSGPHPHPHSVHLLTHLACLPPPSLATCFIPLHRLRQAVLLPGSTPQWCSRETAAWGSSTAWHSLTTSSRQTQVRSRAVCASHRLLPSSLCIQSAACWM
jgi:hypothetical protein